MKTYKVKTVVLKNFNDSKDNYKPYETGDPITLDRDRYEELLSKEIVKVGEIIKEEKEEIKIKKIYKKEEE